MLKVTALLAFVCLGVAVATPLDASSTSFRVREQRQAVPRGFTEVGPAPQDQTLSLRLALAESNPSGLIDALYSVSDPDSASYGHHLSKEQVEQYVAPQAATVQAVNGWLKENGLTSTTLSPAGDWISVSVPVAKANQMFNTNFTVFRNTATGAEVVRTLAYSLPEAIEPHVDLVYPTVSRRRAYRRNDDSFPAPKSDAISGKQTAYHNVVALASSDASPCVNNTNIACLQELYKIPATPATNKTNTLGVSGFHGGAVDSQYVQDFLEMYRPDVNPPANYSYYSIDGGDPNDPGISEGYADLEYTLGLATGVPVTYYFVGINITDGDLSGLLDEANALLALDNPPQVLTTSWNVFDESDISFALTDKLCRAYAQLGARGTSILFASGDNGAGCSPDNTQFEPKFPLNCPFVTAVGGTQSFAPEQGWIGSSGGFSNYYARPAYQDAAVSAFLAAHGEQYQGLLNASGRALPDIAAKADNFLIYVGISYEYVGTSLASPTVASIFALLNDRLVSAGRPPLGFVNPWLYKEGYKAFTDITTGNSTTMCTENITHTIQVTEGWDPVTGLGTPRFDLLVDLLQL
ncbi:family S53 protease-like protein [Cubamyces menziesii]|nr:family S53 protease-like protein [Cubamyces menziesii]